jgi:hypothetical protein
MRYVTAMVAGVIGYALVLLAMGDLLRIEGTSPWYSLPFALSVAVVAAVLFTWRPRARGNRVFAVVAAVLSAVVVLAIDLFGAVWYSCAHGTCL